jgi:hypothetical protein
VGRGSTVALPAAAGPPDSSLCGRLSGTDDVVVTVNAVASFAPILINGGGPTFTDSTGQVWSADQYFSGGFTYATATTTAIGGTVEDTLYRSERVGNFSYNLPVPNGTYAVTLAFAVRVFSLMISPV